MAQQHLMKPLVVLSGQRTPFTKAFGQLKSCQADQLGTDVLKATLAEGNLSAEQLDEVVFGNVATPVHAANIARVIALKAGVPENRPAHTVSRNCASGMESIVSAWQAIEEGRAGVIAAGGVESMSNIPFQFNESFRDWMMGFRKTKGFGQLSQMAKFRPSMLTPVIALQVGLTDPTCGLNMGETAEILAEEFSISRERQDEFALMSHQRAAAAWERCFLGGEVTAVDVEGKTVRRDDGVRLEQSMEALAKLRPVFKKEGGTVTAGNSSQLTDGASALIVSSEDAARSIDAEPLGKIRAYAVAGLDPRRMGLGPVYAIDKLLRLTGRTLDDFDLFEINEAFAAQVLACVEAMKSMDFCRDKLNRSEAIGEIPIDRLNVNGGAIALGHPLGASGNRLVLTLMRALKERGLQHGLAALCIGGGQGMAMWVERTAS